MMIRSYRIIIKASATDFSQKPVVKEASATDFLQEPVVKETFATDKDHKPAKTTHTPEDQANRMSSRLPITASGVPPGDGGRWATTVNPGLID